MTERKKGAMTQLDEFDDGSDGDLVIDYDEPGIPPEPPGADIKALDCALQYASIVAPGAPRPDLLVARPENDGIAHFFQVQQVANDVRSPGLASIVPPYVAILYEMSALRARRGSNRVMLRIGALYDAGYEVLIWLVSDGAVGVHVQPIGTGLRESINPNGMTAQGFTPPEVVDSLLRYRRTPAATLLELRRLNPDN